MDIVTAFVGLIRFDHSDPGRRPPLQVLLLNILKDSKESDEIQNSRKGNVAVESSYSDLFAIAIRSNPELLMESR